MEARMPNPAMILPDAVTRIADRSDPVPDEIWEEATRHYDETQLSGLLIAIALPTRQLAGSEPR